MNEIWKDVLGYEGLYQISNLGNIKSLERKVKRGRCGIYSLPERVLKPVKYNGYLFVNLYKGIKEKRFYIHRLVANAFIPNPQGLPQVNHKDEDKTNNTVDNLEWCTQEYNNNYGTRNKRSSEKRINNIKKSKPVLCVETGVIYPSVGEVQRQLGYAQGNICNCCLGKKHFNTAYGYHWQYVA